MNHGITRIPLVLGNWKMNTTLDEATALARSAAAAATLHPDVEVGVLPPVPWLVPLANHLGAASAVQLGAQTVAPEPAGAFTGDISAEMLAPYTRFMLVGHSERRQHHGETNAQVRARLDAVLRVDRVPVLAIGETQEERESGRATDVVATQLASALDERPPGALQSLVIAYEPVWAIGTGASATVADASNMAGFIRDRLRALDVAAAGRIRILYGGSVKPDTAAGFFAAADLDGGLIGGASLQAEAFTAIAAAASTTMV